MPTLNIFFVLYTDGATPHSSGHPAFQLSRLDAVPVPQEEAEFFGPHAQAFPDQARRARAAFLLHGQRTVRGGVGEFFSQAHAELTACVAGLDGYALDLLKGWPLPFS